MNEIHVIGHHNPPIPIPSCPPWLRPAQRPGATGTMWPAQNHISDLNQRMLDRLASRRPGRCRSSCTQVE